MRRILLVVIVLSLTAPIAAQQLTGSQLLEKAIAYHDPNNQWSTFKGDLQVTMETPDASKRTSSIFLDLPNSQFDLKVSKDGDSYGYTIKNDSCEISLNGSTTISEADKEKFRLSSERGKMYRNYYTYLYGLPMKLQDKGTLVHEKVERKTFKSKEYLVLKVDYNPEVGKDTWYFYFDPNTFAMEVYQFYHDESKNDGEYILLSGMEEINGIKMPKTRKWYYNKDDKYLGTDILEN